MQVSRRAFLGSAAAMALFRDGFAAPGGDMKVFAPNGGQAADFLICRRLYLDICGRIPTRWWSTSPVDWTRAATA